MKKLFLFILLATTLNLFAHFPIAVDTDKSRGLIYCTRAFAQRVHNGLHSELLISVQTI